MPIKAPKTYPYTSVGVIEIYYMENGERAKAVGTGYLFHSTNYQRRDLVIGAGHNLVHLADFEEVHFTRYGDRDVYTVAVSRAGKACYAIEDHKLPFDFGVMLLSEEVSQAATPIPLVEPPLNGLLPGEAAGGLAREVELQNRDIYFSEMGVRTDVQQVLIYPVGTTEAGMSGGPILTPNSQQTLVSIGTVHGEGTVQGEIVDLATRIDIVKIENLVEQALAIKEQ